MKRFIGILQFLSRITVIKELPYDDEFKKGIIFFPVVGFILGLLLLFIFRLSNILLPYQVVIILTLGSYVILTGGLHLDGLGDTFDGLYSNRPKDQILEIMRDSRLGTNGVLAILFIIFIKVFGLMNLRSWDIYGALVMMPVFGRLSLVFGCFNSQYPREKGLGNIFIGKVNNKEVFISIIITLLFTILQPISIFYIPILWVITIFFKRHCSNKIGGMTGDTLGALCELVEVAYILYLLITIKLF
ncbi:adenosylcobinamide-GDP ribazoletransferase [Alkaliphilus peptidifermentans]|uniref:Adenosylcobinamide-GDP ribazoletransferase n=1 Tax=Alkaliphilus peptidifermentans DSM 18978 TaxID=1120976 RepID=A0A1G5K247_9FIRM|nr:adenosylcobinamide-GDP ribazoletransferase [Alkaliphilus peptidifermentans]SCY94715.1 cobalamin-5'-phosphate synthase [Alkaliphilus peptidifermentans DSM 18978]